MNSWKERLEDHLPEVHWRNPATKGLSSGAGSILPETRWKTVLLLPKPRAAWLLLSIEPIRWLDAPDLDPSQTVP